jgi:catechol 2,3-dioxygenase-like lactoylglutathione lyase family enzyme
MFQGLRTVIYPAPDLEAAKEWWSSVLGMAPYFDEPFYVGFNVGGYELGLDPEADVEAGSVTYWGVPNIEQALGVLMGGGAQPRTDISDVGEGIKVATVLSPTEDVVGVIENPHFKLPG